MTADEGMHTRAAGVPPRRVHGGRRSLLSRGGGTATFEVLPLRSLRRPLRKTRTGCGSVVPGRTPYPPECGQAAAEGARATAPTGGSRVAAPAPAADAAGRH